MTAQDVDTPGAGGPRRPNPEAIAWYVEEAQRLLEDQQRWIESLRTRGGQIAGFGAAVLALIGGNAKELITSLDGTAQVIVDFSLVASVFCIAVSVVVATWGVLRPQGFSTIAAGEVAAYSSKRFLREPELWRVQARSLHAFDRAVADAQEVGGSAARAIEWSLRAFLAGFAFSLLAVATLLAGVV